MTFQIQLKGLEEGGFKVVQMVHITPMGTVLRAKTRYIFSSKSSILDPEVVRRTNHIVFDTFHR